MSDPGAPPAKASSSWIRRLDDAVFAVEQAVVATFLGAMTVMVFLDVVSRRLSAADSKVGSLLARLFGVTDEAGRAMLDTQVAPIVSAALGVSIVWLAVTTMRRRDDPKAKAIDAATLGRTALACAVLGALGWLIAAQRDVDVGGFTETKPLLSSKYFYLLLYALVAGPIAARIVRARETGWQRQAAAIGAGAVALAAVGLKYFPDEYSWSLEVAGIMILWVGALGASICAYAGKHIRFEALSKLAPPAILRFVHAGSFVLTALFCVVLTVLSTRSLLIMSQADLVFPQTGMPDAFASSALPLAFTLASLRFLGGAVSALRGGTYGQPDPNEVPS